MVLSAKYGRIYKFKYKSLVAPLEYTSEIMHPITPSYVVNANELVVYDIEWHNASLLNIHGNNGNYLNNITSKDSRDQHVPYGAEVHINKEDVVTKSEYSELSQMKQESNSRTISLKAMQKSAHITQQNLTHIQEKAPYTLENLYYNRTQKINTFPFKCIICQPQLCRDRPDALVLVNSRADAFAQRKAIRDTWGMEVRKGRCYGKSLPGLVAVGFVVGLQNNRTVQNKIELESHIYHDIIQGDFIDHYTNLTFKSLLAMDWTKKYCLKGKYFIKSDDDMVINFPYLFQVINQGTFSKSIMGPHYASGYVLRSGKWKVTEKEFPLKFYPPYESGSAYVMTMDLICPLLDASQYYPYFAIDDAYITGILAKHIKAKHVIKSGFSFPGTPKPTPCDFLDSNRFTGHSFSAADMRFFWKALRNTACEGP